MALARVGFSGVVVWLEGCVLGRSGESVGVDLDGVGVDSDGAVVDCCPAMARGLDYLRGLPITRPFS
jgi:hypothetical protein